MFSPGVCRGSPSRVSTSPVWSTGCFWLLGAGSCPVGPLCFLASSHSGICAVRVGVPPCSLAPCGAPWLMVLRSGHCRFTGGLASMDGPLLVSSDESQLSTSCVVKRSSFGLFALASRQVFAQSSIGTNTLLPPSRCLVGVFAMRSPCRVEFVADLDRNEDSSRSFPSGWCPAFAMGSPVSGRVALF